MVTIRVVVTWIPLSCSGFGEPYAASAVKEYVVGEGYVVHNNVLVDELLESGGLASTDVIVKLPYDQVAQGVWSVDPGGLASTDDSTKNKGKGRGKGEKNKSFVGFSNKFETLVKDIGEVGGTSPRATAAGVANILLEMKAKKKTMY
ncbi:hypothetical protein V6N13_110014 [Hibiscus sabdariffa]